jgi:hypothetical protein
MRRSEGGWTNVADTWVQTVQRMLAANPAGILSPFDINRAVDAWFDFAASVLAVNREYAKTIVRAATWLPTSRSKQAQ